MFGKGKGKDKRTQAQKEAQAQAPGTVHPALIKQAIDIRTCYGPRGTIAQAQAQEERGLKLW